MNIVAHIEPLTSISADQDLDIYKIMEVHMQQKGHLIAYREHLNWSNKVGSIVIGENETLDELKKIAAKNDRVFLLVAKLFKQTVYKHVILHPNTKGIYLPFSFDEPFKITIQDQTFTIGSSVRLLEELKWLSMTMKKLDQSEKVVTMWKNFQEACHKSIDTLTPIVLEMHESENISENETS